MRKTEKKWNCVSLWDEFVALRWYYIQFYRSTKNCIHSNNTHLLASAASQCEPQLPMFIQFSFLCLWITHRAYRLYTLIQCFCYCWCLLKLYFSISFIFLFLFLFLLFLFHFVRIRRARAQHMVFFLLLYIHSAVSSSVVWLQKFFFFIRSFVPMLHFLTHFTDDASLERCSTISMSTSVCMCLFVYMCVSSPIVENFRRFVFWFVVVSSLSSIDPRKHKC